MNKEQTLFVKYLIRTGMLDVVRQSKVQTLIGEFKFEHFDDYKYTINKAGYFLPQRCHHCFCLAAVGNMFCCRKLNNVHITNNSTLFNQTATKRLYKYMYRLFGLRRFGITIINV